MPTPVVKPKVQYFTQPLHHIADDKLTEWLNSPAQSGWRLHTIIVRDNRQFAVWEMEMIDEDAEIEPDLKDAVVAAAQKVFFGITEDDLIGQPGSSNILTALHDLGEALVNLEKRS